MVQNASPKKPTHNTALRLTPDDQRAIDAIKKGGFARNQSEAIRFALQRAVRWVRSQDAA